jgi:hypothetical protein
MSKSSAGKGDKPRPVNLQKYEQNWENIFRKTITDGFGNEWPLCKRKDCGLSVVRPGKVQCDLCDE